jgi:hypothetical protein
MSHISLSDKRIDSNGAVITRRIIIPKNKYSKFYLEHKERMDRRETYDVPVVRK